MCGEGFLTPVCKVCGDLRDEPCFEVMKRLRNGVVVETKEPRDRLSWAPAEVAQSLDSTVVAHPLRVDRHRVFGSDVLGCPGRPIHLTDPLDDAHCDSPHDSAQELVIVGRPEVVRDDGQCIRGYSLEFALRQAAPPESVSDRDGDAQVHPDDL